MSDWSSFLKSNEFRDYRKKQVEMVAEVLNKKYSATVVGSGSDISETKGQMDMAERMLRLPSTLTHDKKTLEFLDMQMVEDMANLTRYLMRKAMTEE